MRISYDHAFSCREFDELDYGSPEFRTSRHFRIRSLRDLLFIIYTWKRSGFINAYGF